MSYFWPFSCLRFALVWHMTGKFLGTSCYGYDDGKLVFVTHLPSVTAGSSPSLLLMATCALKRQKLFHTVRYCLSQRKARSNYNFFTQWEFRVCYSYCNPRTLYTLCCCWPIDRYLLKVLKINQVRGPNCKLRAKFFSRWFIAKREAPGDKSMEKTRNPTLTDHHFRLIRKIRTRNVKCSWPLEKAWTGTDLNTVVITKIKETHTDSLQNVDAIILLWKVLKRLFAIVQLRRKEAEIKRSVVNSEDRPKLPKSWHKSNGSRASLKKRN